MHGGGQPGFDGESLALGNNLLSALRKADADLVWPHLEPWRGDLGSVLFEPGETVHCVYFPCGSSMISFLVVLEDGRTIDAALIGREGAAGGIVSNGRLPAYTRAEVQFAGPFLKMEIARLEDAKQRSHTLGHLFARYADCLMAQIFQAVACNAAHSIEQRTAKWLISAIERSGTSELVLTQEHLAAMLGVGRSYISRVIGSLKERGVLEISRGRIGVRDIQQVKAIACGCNDCVRDHFDEVLKGVYPDEPLGLAA